MLQSYHLALHRPVNSRTRRMSVHLFLILGPGLLVRGQAAVVSLLLPLTGWTEGLSEALSSVPCSESKSNSSNKEVGNMAAVSCTTVIAVATHD